jgi:hypothetical protein
MDEPMIIKCRGIYVPGYVAAGKNEREMKRIGK